MSRDWFTTRGPWQAAAGFASWPVNRPYVMRYWVSEDIYGISLSWGNKNSDPVWYLALSFPIPPWRKLAA